MVRVMFPLLFDASTDYIADFVSAYSKLTSELWLGIGLHDCYI